MTHKFVVICFVTILIKICVAQRPTTGETINIWSQWNREGTIRYGILERNRTREEAEQICVNNNFQSLVQIKSYQEDEDFLRVYMGFLGVDFAQSFEFEEPIFSEPRTFWNGIIRENSTTFRYIDGMPVGMYNLFIPPEPRPNVDCSSLTIECTEGCNIYWESVSCDSRSMVICQSIENRTELEAIQEFLQNGIPLTTEQANIVTEIVFNSTSEENLTLETLTQGIEILTEITAITPELEISESAYQNVLETAENYITYIEENIEEFVNQSTFAAIVMITEDYLNRVNITSDLLAVDFQTARLIAEVRYVSSETNLTFTVTGNTSFATITVPQEAVESVEPNSGPGNQSRISFVRYDSSVLFPSQATVSQVISAQINGVPIDNLVFPVNFALDLKEKASNLDVRFIQCAAWSFESSSWNRTGCFVIALSDPPLCGCNHLTNFAILVETFQRPAYPIFDVINSIIGALSCIGFFLTGSIFLWFKDLRQSKPGPVHIHLCFNLFIGFTIFLSASTKTDNRVGCIIITAFTHYFFLTSWLWMFIESLLLHKMLVVKSQQLDKRFIVYSSLLSYGLPLIIVMINIGVTVLGQDMQNNGPWTQLNSDILYNSTYVSNFYCWLHGYSLYFGFLTPGALIFSANLILFVLVIRAFTWGRKKIQSTRTEASPNQQICRIMTVGFMMGIVWVLSVPIEILANVEYLTEVLTYITSVLLAIQGIAMFYLFCVRKKRARRLWLDPIVARIRRCCSPKESYKTPETDECNLPSSSKNIQALSFQNTKSSSNI